MKQRREKMPRIQISISDENLKLLEKVSEKSGLSKSAQINSLITKFLSEEFKINEKGGEVQ